MNSIIYELLYLLFIIVVCVLLVIMGTGKSKFALFLKSHTLEINKKGFKSFLQIFLTFAFFTTFIFFAPVKGLNHNLFTWDSLLFIIFANIIVPIYGYNKQVKKLLQKSPE